MKLKNALKTIAENQDLKEKVLELCREIENTIDYSGDIREDITGPIIDELYTPNTIIRKELANGLVFEFYYRTKIARDFIMSDPPVPDHVWEPQTTKLLMYLSQNAGNVIVGGAYFGDQTILICSQLARDEGVCHAFEPNTDQFERLKHNANINNLTNLRPWNQPLWCDSNSKLMLVGDDSYAFTQKSEQGMTTVSIDDYIEKMGISKIDLIMIDIEGAEEKVLRGASKLLNRYPEGPTIVFEVHRNYVNWDSGLENSDILRFLQSCGYDHIFAIRDYNSNINMANCPIELIPCNRVYLEGPPHGFNMIALKDPSIIQNGFFEIVYDVSPKLLKHRDPAIFSPLHR